MKNFTTAGAILFMTTSMVQALGLDRSGQNIGIIFEDAENYVELSYGSISPSVSGTDAASQPTGNVSQDYSQFGFGFKHQYSDAFSAAFIFDQPYGADILYPASTPVFAGTAADVNSEAYTVMGRYELGNGFSFQGGVRAQSIDADVTLGGGAYGPLSGYNLQADGDHEFGYLVGAAYERPDIALRVALTYFSAIDHQLDTIETLGVFPPNSQTTVTTPQAVNLDFQTGIAADTLLFGSIRWADYEQTIVSPTVFGVATSGGSLTDFDTDFTYNIGVGRRFTDAFSASISAGYEAEGDVLVSALIPTNGNYSVAVGGAYDFSNGMELSGGVRYIVIGDADIATGDGTVGASFEDNSAVAVGMKIAYSF
jgi:long-subunit fatty acid transport protein